MRRRRWSVLKRSQRDTTRVAIRAVQPERHAGQRPGHSAGVPSTGATAYKVYEGTSVGEGATPILTVSTGTTVAVTGPTNGRAYYFKVAAVNSIATRGVAGSERHAC